MKLTENTLFANRYQLIRLLGRGGFSEVWLAEDSLTKLQVALKVYAPGMGMDSNGLQEFSSELAGVYNLNHSNLLKPQHVDAWEGMPYLIMSYCANGSIKNKVGSMTEQEVWKLLNDVGKGLDYLHHNGIVHQDIKPDNIMQDDNGNYLITDFGISTKARTTLRKSVVGASLSAGSGTVAYMGPERFSKQPAPTKASDIWSLGATVFELVTGDVPFGDMLGGGMQKGGAEIPEITAEISPRLVQTIEAMLAKETWDRPTAAQLVDIANGKDDFFNKSQPEMQPKTQPNTQSQATIPLQQPQAELSVKPDKLHFDNHGDTKEITINSTLQWSAEAHVGQDKWFRLSKLSENKIAVKCEKNKDSRERTGSIVVKSAGKEAKIQVIQDAGKKSLWWLWTILIAVVLVIGGVIISEKVKERQREIERMERIQIMLQDDIEKISTFDKYVARASTDNINDLRSAYDALKEIQRVESDSDFPKDAKKYTARKGVLSRACDRVYNDLNSKYIQLPPESGVAQGLKSKMNTVNSIKQNLE